ncbi:MAG: hypothetical protein WC321_05445 [Candidatus Omnitrophota bacterium]|jgi:hypothetical protein
MPENNKLGENDDQPIFALLQQIKDGTADASTFTKELRQGCVEVLLGEGSSVTLMAQVLKRSEKTIKRDIEDIRERNAIAPDINLAKKIVGELLMYARINRDHLMKLARSKEVSVAEKAQSEYCAFKVFSELVTKLQSLGYLPLKPQAIVGDIFHHVDGEIPDFDELTRQIIEIEEITDGDGKIADDIKEDISKMKAVVEKIKPSDKNINQKEKTNEDR